MRKMIKFLLFEGMQLVVEEQHPKDISRARLKLIDKTENDKEYKTLQYGEVSPLSIRWSSTIEMVYTAQQSLQFETICEHEYGYQIEELKALYNGIVYLKADQFFTENRTHAFDRSGKQCGIFKFVIRIIEREEINHKLEDKFQEPKERIQVSLIGKVSLYSANLSISPHAAPLFFKKKRNLHLQIRYDKSILKGHAKFDENEYRWLLSGKLQINDNSPQIIYAKIMEDDSLYIDGVLHVSMLQKNKRFSIQAVQLCNQNQQKIGFLHLDMRYISKKELLDLMYSPKMLKESTMESNKDDHHFEMKEKSLSLAHTKPLRKIVAGLESIRSTSKQLVNSRKKSPSNRQQAIDQAYTKIHQSLAQKDFLIRRIQILLQVISTPMPYQIFHLLIPHRLHHITGNLIFNITKRIIFYPAFGKKSDPIHHFIYLLSQLSFQFFKKTIRNLILILKNYNSSILFDIFLKGNHQNNIKLMKHCPTLSTL